MQSIKNEEEQLMNEKKKIIRIIEDKREKLIQAADAIWETPETRFETKLSVQEHYNILEEEGFDIQKGVADMEYAYIASYGLGKPVIGILAEYDALDSLSQVSGISEEKAIVTDGKGHGCGHNLLGIGALAGALGVKELLKEGDIQGTIKLFGCPAEESGYGKAFMARDGVFDELDIALTWHPMDFNAAWGISSLAVYQAYYNFKGVSSHAAATPEKGRSALDAAELMNIGVQFMREHMIDDARVHYAFKDTGGASANVVQSTASLYYFIRAPKLEQAKELFERVNKIAEGAAMMTETEVEIVIDSACANYIPNKFVTTSLYNNLKEVLPIEFTEEELGFEKELFDTVPEREKKALYMRNKQLFPQLSNEEIKELSNQPIHQKLFPLFFLDKTSGSTDVGDVSWVVPTGQVTVSCEPQGAANHSWQWVANGKSCVAHKGMLTAGKAIAMAAYDFFVDPEQVKKAKEEHLKNLAGRSYQSGIPKEVKPKQ